MLSVGAYHFFFRSTLFFRFTHLVYIYNLMKLFRSFTLLFLCSLCQWATAQPQRRAEANAKFFQATAHQSRAAQQVDEAGQWTSLGTGRMRDDFFTTLYVVECLEFDVEIEESVEKPGLYRVVTPYRNYPCASTKPLDEDTYMLVDATDPDHVFLHRYKTGFDFETEAENESLFIIEIYSIAGYKYDHEGNLDGAIDEGACGTLRNGCITFPVGSLLVKYASSPDEQWRFANYNNGFRLKLPGAPDLDVSISVLDLIKGTDKDQLSVHFNVGSGCEKVRVAMFQGEASNDSLAAMHAGTCAYQDITSSQEVLFDYSADGIYTIIAVPYYNGEPQQPAHTTQELKFYNVGWNSLGQALYTEAFIADCEVPISGITSCTYSVDVEESTERPGYFRLVDPYGDNYPYSNSLSYDNTRHYYMEIDATDPACVSIKQMEDGCGYDMGYGKMVLWSRADRALEQGKTKEEVKELGYFGTLEGNVITFPKDMLLISFPDVLATWYWANNKSKFRLELPEGAYTGIHSADSAQAAGEPVYYNLQGCQVAKSQLTPGVYVKRQGKSAQKIIVK